jgi:hypothetical protein
LQAHRLRRIPRRYGACRWSLISTHLSTGRTGKQCRERWNNHLCPEVKKTKWSESEDHAILCGVAQIGTRWCELIKAPNLAGRTDNAIKNRFYSLRRHTRARLVAAAHAQAAAGYSPGGDREALAERQKERVVSLATRLAGAEDDAARDALILSLAAALHAGDGDDDRHDPNGDADPIGANENSDGDPNGADQISDSGDEASGTARLSAGDEGAARPAGGSPFIDLNSRPLSPSCISVQAMANSAQGTEGGWSLTASSADIASNPAPPLQWVPTLPLPEPDQACSFGPHTSGPQIFGPQIFGLQMSGLQMFGLQMGALLGLRKLDSLTEFRMPASTSACNSGGEAECPPEAKSLSSGDEEAADGGSAVPLAFVGFPDATRASPQKCTELVAPTAVSPACAPDGVIPDLAVAPPAPGTTNPHALGAPTAPPHPAPQPALEQCDVFARMAPAASPKKRRAFRSFLAPLVLPLTPVGRADKRQRTSAGSVSHSHTESEAESPTAGPSLDTGLFLDTDLSLGGVGSGEEALERTKEPSRVPSAVATFRVGRAPLSIS